ncbi:MAG TPA: ATP-binding cassette domain-containing protein [Roseateles sp.]|nr:ATP-binding cassette domain-containing protein [Roseateles sp.]
MPRRHLVLRLFGQLVRSPYRWQMLATLVLSSVILGIELLLGIQLARLLGRMIDTLTRRDGDAYQEALLLLLACLAAFFVCTGVYLYTNLRLKMQARTALTYPWLRRWLDEEAIYRLEREQRVDNPDQRIAEDLGLFLDRSLGLLMGALGAFGGVWMYSAELWREGGSFELSLGGQSWSVAGYLFWVALAYSLLDFLLTRRIARPQIGLSMEQQHAEADFRYAMVQVREHAEQVALYRGAATELRRLIACFERVRQNWWRLIAFQAGLSVYSALAAQVTTFLIYLLLGPKVLAGALTVGAMVALQSLYGQTLGKLNWFANAWSEIVGWIAVVKRLQQLDRGIEAGPAGGITVRDADGATLSTQALSLRLPGGRVLADIGDLRVQAGQRWLVRGPSGVGKSTLLRAIAGLWPHGQGRIETPLGRLLFLPQKSYLPWDSLKVVLSYPDPVGRYSDEECRRALVDCRLPRLAERLHECQRWSMQLSPGEQQRLAFARALLACPDFLFLDESTSALDADTESHLYGLLLERLSATVLVSVAHRPALARFHTHGLSLAAEGPARIEQLVTST